MKKHRYPYKAIEFRAQNEINKAYWCTYSSFIMNVPKNNKHYRIYLSRCANQYKKYYAKVRKSISNDQHSSVSAHKAWLTRELKDLKWRFNSNLIEQCSELLAKQ